MVSLSVPAPPLRDYMSYFAADENVPFNSNYASILAPYIIDVAAPTAASVMADISRKFTLQAATPQPPSYYG